MRRERDPSSVSHRRAAGSGARGLSAHIVRILLAAALFALLGMSLYLAHYRPYRAAQLFYQAYYDARPVAERTALARESFDTFPPLAAMPRRLLLSRLTSYWDDLDLEERRLVVDFVETEGLRGLDATPDNARLIARVLPVLQAVASSPEDLERLEPSLERLRALAPQRLATHQLLAGQEVQKGNYREALRIVQEFEAVAPWVTESFDKLRQAAEKGLDQPP